jgi:anti-sigma B factor antagonist
MQLNFERTNGVVVVTGCARVDGRNARSFEKALRDIAQDGDHALVVDFGQLQYIGSAGLRALLMSANNFSAQGLGFGIFALPAHVRRVFAISVDNLIAIYETKEDAVAALSG